MIYIVDQLNRPLKLMEPAKRIVSLVPSISEYLYDLGLEDEVVGITKFCIKPEKWFRNKTRVGGTKTLSLEKIEQLNPDLIIANKEENTQEQIEFLSKKYPVFISNIVSIEETKKCLQDIGKLTGRDEQAAKVLDKITTGIKVTKGIVYNASCLYFIWRDPYLTAGSPTFINTILNHLGFNNLASNFDGRYPELDQNKFAQLSPQFILLASEPFPFSKDHLSEFKSLFPMSKVILVDGEAFSWYGSRLVPSAKYFKSLSNSLTK